MYVHVYTCIMTMHSSMYIHVCDLFRALKVKRVGLVSRENKEKLVIGLVTSDHMHVYYTCTCMYMLWPSSTYVHYKALNSKPIATFWIMNDSIVILSVA